jgi:hypothetical protein
VSEQQCCPLDEDAAIEEDQEISMIPHLREVLRREHDEILEARPHNEPLEKWRDEIKEMILRDLVCGVEDIKFAEASELK